MSENEKEVGVEFSLEDHATAKLNLMHTAAEKVASGFEKASHLVGTFGSIAAIAGGAFSAHEVIAGTLHHIENIKKIVDITGIAAEKADGMIETFAKAGVGTEEVVQAMQQMSKAGARLEQMQFGAQMRDQAKIAGKGVNEVASAQQAVNAQMAQGHSLLQRLGIDVNKGPEAAFKKMAEAAQKGKLGAAEMAIAMRVNFDTARKMFTVLKLGPQAFAESVDELKRKGLAVTADSVALYAEIQKKQFEIKATWERISIVVGQTFLPVIKDLLTGVEDHLEGWLAHAKSFGETMSRFLKEHYQLVQNITKVLLVNFALQKATGSGLVGGANGPGGWLGKGVGMFNSAKGMLGGAWAAGSPIAAAFRAKRKYQETDYGEGFGREANPSKIRDIFTSVGSMFFKMQPTLGLLLKVTASAGAAFLVFEGIEGVMKNVQGITDYLQDVWDRIASHFDGMRSTFDAINTTFGGGSLFSDFFKVVLPMAIGGLGELVDGLLTGYELITSVLAAMTSASFWKNPLQGIADAVRETLNEHRAAAEQHRNTREASRIAAAMAGANFDDLNMPSARTPKDRENNHYDFRGSRFDITQKFAEGFDPGRVAVAFTNDLATLGERRLQSQFSHPLAVR